MSICLSVCLKGHSLYITWDCLWEVKEYCPKLPCEGKKIKDLLTSTMMEENYSFYKNQRTLGYHMGYTIFLSFFSKSFFSLMFFVHPFSKFSII